MARCSVAGRASVAPTSARGPSLYAPAGRRLHVVEVGVWNTTTTACAIGLVRATTTGTQGAGLTEICEDDPTLTPAGTGFQTHTADATVGSQFRQASLGAAIGSGVIWTFPAPGVEITEGTGNGVVIYCPTGTGQIVDFYIAWIE